jgi:hypothetical protein
LGAQAEPAHAVLEAMAAGVRTAFGWAATSVAIFTGPPVQARVPAARTASFGSPKVACPAVPGRCEEICWLGEPAAAGPQ